MFINVDYDPSDGSFSVTKQPLAEHHLSGLFYGREIEGGLRLHAVEAAFLMHQTEYAARLGIHPHVRVTIKDAETGRELSRDDVLYGIMPQMIKWPLSRYTAYALIRTAGHRRERWEPEVARMQERCLVRVLMGGEAPFFGGAGAEPIAEEGAPAEPPGALLTEDFDILWFDDDKVGVIANPHVAEALTNVWIGTVKYKVGGMDEAMDQTLKLDSLETLYVIDLLTSKGKSVRVADAKTGEELSHDDILKKVRGEWPRFEELYEVYRDWRSRGYGTKTALSFGAQARIYAVGSSPFSKEEEYVHSLYLVNTAKPGDEITPLDIIAAGRLARTVRKASIWGIVGLDPSKVPHVQLDYAYWSPGIDDAKRSVPPMFATVTLPEHASVRLDWLAGVYETAARARVQPVTHILDRERSSALYLLKRIDLAGSPNYYLGAEFMCVDDVLPKPRREEEMPRISEEGEGA